MTPDARALAKASGAAQRAYGPLAELVRVSRDLPLNFQRQANNVIEELDLFRHFVREATLERVIARNEVPAVAARSPPPPKKRAKVKRAARK